MRSRMTTFRDLVLRLMETGPFDQVQLAERLGVTKGPIPSSPVGTASRH